MICCGSALSRNADSLPKNNHANMARECQGDFRNLRSQVPLDHRTEQSTVKGALSFQGEVHMGKVSETITKLLL